MTIHDPDYGFLDSDINVKLSAQLSKTGLRLAHIKDLKRFFFRMQSIYPRDFNRRKLALGWSMGGFSPWNPRLPLSHCIGFTKLDPPSRRHFLDTILPKLIEEMAKEGEVSDGFMDALKISAGPYGFTHYVTTPFEKKVALNMRRAFLVNHPKQEENRAILVTEKQRERLQRIEGARPLLLRLKTDILTLTEEQITKMADKNKLQGLLELLNTENSLYLSQTGKPKVNKNIMVALVKEKVVALVNAEAAAQVLDDNAEDNYEDDEFELEDDFDNHDDL